MKKEGKKYTIIILVVAVIVIVTAIIFNNLNNQDNNQSKIVDISHVYVSADFPDNILDEESLNRFLEKLNQDYDYLRQNIEYDYYDIWVDIGNTKLGLKDYMGAEEAWLQAIGLNQDRALAYANLANFYKDFKHDYSQAEEYYDLAITKDNIGYFPDYQSFAELYIYYLPEDPYRIETIMLMGADKSPNVNKVPFYYYLYDYFKSKDSTKSDFYYQKVLETDPNFDFSQYE